MTFSKFSALLFFLTTAILLGIKALLQEESTIRTVTPTPAFTVQIRQASLLPTNIKSDLPSSFSYESTGCL